MPRVGSSRISSRGSVISQRASSTFCWLPPLRLRDRAVGVGRADVAAPRCTCRPARPAGGAGCGRVQPRRGLQREDDVLPHGQLGDEALGPAVLRAERDAAGRSRRSGLRSGTGLPSTVTWPRSARSAPNSSRASSVRPEPSSPARPTTSPGVDGQVERGDRARRGRARGAWSSGRVRRAAVRPVCSSSSLQHVQLLADHLARPGRAGGARRSGTRRPALPLRSTVIRSAIS